MPHLQQVSPRRVGAKSSCGGKQAIGISMYQRSLSHGHNFCGQKGGRSVPRALVLGRLCLEQLEVCLCCLPNPGPRCPQPLVAVCLLVAVVSRGHFPSHGSGFGVSLLLARATEGLHGSRSAGLRWALQLISCSSWTSVFHTVKWGQRALLTRLLTRLPAY